ncbi:MAG: hypothetical protein BZY88_11465 [SAR202 cluster bacterium Io17-Chloro-G9]|nr:MAG: hypothetical protein BZY88_11465 [SAR202 cluster bacterium Io17-Chloro-G9]
MAFGALLIWEVARYWTSGAISGMYVDPQFHFTYMGFGWITAWPGQGMYFHFFGLMGLAFLIMIGLWYRVSAFLFFLGFTYLFLIDKAYYLNHFYLISLLSLLLIFVPSHNSFSLDALRRGTGQNGAVPAWALWLLRFQLGIVYFYAGIAKLHWDWLTADPIRVWMAERTDVPIISAFYNDDWFLFLFSYGGLFLDLFAVPLLFWSRSRPYVFAVLVLFHITNAEVFSIGIFPWLMIAATLLFFSPDWPRRLAGWLTRFGRRKGVSGLPAQGQRSRLQPPPETKRTALRYVGLAALAIFVTMQVLVPLRHFIYPGDANWTEEGSRFAWRMMLRAKTGETRITVMDPVTHTTSEIESLVVLTTYQARVMSRFPNMVLQWSHHVADDLRGQGYPQIQVRAYVPVSLNGRPPQLLVDPQVDLAAEKFSLWQPDWVLPLQ